MPDSLPWTSVSPNLELPVEYGTPDTANRLSQITTVTLTIAIYRATFHPIAKIPGLRLWTITRLPFFYNLAIGRLHARIHDFHSEYGPVVRVAPGEISFITESSWSDIYLKPVGKPQLEKEFAQYKLAEGAPGIALEADDYHHSRNRFMNSWILQQVL